MTDGPPALALGVDPADEGLMHRPPRPADEGLTAIASSVLWLREINKLLGRRIMGE